MGKLSKGYFIYLLFSAFFSMGMYTWYSRSPERQYKVQVAMAKVIRVILAVKAALDDKAGGAPSTPIPDTETIVRLIQKQMGAKPYLPVGSGAGGEPVTGELTGGGDRTGEGHTIITDQTGAPNQQQALKRMLLPGEQLDALENQIQKRMERSMPTDAPGFESSPNGAQPPASVSTDRSVSTGSSMDDSEKYVLIQGKYYRYRSDHTYMVNGKPYFYDNKRPYDFKVRKTPRKPIYGGDQRSGASERTGLAGQSAPTEMMDASELINAAEKPEAESNQ